MAIKTVEHLVSTHLSFVWSVPLSDLSPTPPPPPPHTHAQQEQVKESSRKVRLSDIFHFTPPYWLLALSIMFFYNGVFPFVADAR